MSTEVQLMTADELLAKPDDGFVYELIKTTCLTAAMLSQVLGLVSRKFFLSTKLRINRSIHEFNWKWQQW